MRRFVRRLALLALNWAGEECQDCGTVIDHLTAVCSYCFDRRGLDAALNVRITDVIGGQYG